MGIFSCSIMDSAVIYLFFLCSLGVNGFTWQPLPHNLTTTTVASTTNGTKPNVTTSTAPTTTSKFTWGPLHNVTTPEPIVSSTSSKYTFTWPNLHSTTSTKPAGNDLIPIIVGAALGGLVIVVLASYIIVQYRLKKKREESDREKLVE